MASRILIFGASGYTGRLAAAALVDRGKRPVLVGRRPDRLAAVAAELGGLTTAVADSTRPGSIRSLLEEGDVLVTTVGPFVRLGGPALKAAIDAGVTYLDSTGEPAFVRRVFQEEGPRAEGRCGLLTAFGYDYVPGNLAGALALRDAGASATRVDIGYFITGTVGPQAVSTGTLASAAGVLLEDGHAWRTGRLVLERSARGVFGFEVGGRTREGISIGGSEHFTLPRFAPQVQQVNVALGWFGPLARAVQVSSAVNALVSRLPGTRMLIQAAVAPLASRTAAGPDQAARARTGSQVVAIARDRSGTALATVHLEGPNGYTFTGAILAWGADQAAGRGVDGTGALGPVDAFGLAALEAGCAQAGLVRRDS